MSSTDYSSDDSSDQSYDEPSQRRFCAFRTDRFSGHECSRYFDCPAHTIRRPASDGGDEDDENDEIGDYDVDDPEDPENMDFYEQVDDSLEPEEALLLVPDEPIELHGAADAPEHGEHGDAPGAGNHVVNLTTPTPPQEGRGGTGLAGASNAPGNGGGQMQGRIQPTEVIDLTGDSPEPSPTSGSRAGIERLDEERALPTIPDSASGSNSPLSRGGDISPSPQRRPITPPSPPPPTRRRTSANNIGTAPRPNIMQNTMQAPRPPASRRPSELVLPRWQPDAEVTFCPICRTQFSFLIRKHHCR